MWGLIGLDKKSQIERETGTLNDTRSEIENWDLGDRLRSALTGVSREEIRKGVAEREEKRINNLMSTQTGNIQEALGGTGIDVSDLSIRENETETKYRKRLAQLSAKGGAVSRYAAVDGSDLSNVKGNMSTQQIMKLTQDQKKKNKDTEKQEVKDEVRRQEERQDGKEAAAIRRADSLLERTELREDRKDARAALLRAQERKDALELRRDNMNLEYARLAQADRRASQDRRDKAIMMLVQGLGNLGTAFTV